MALALSVILLLDDTFLSAENLSPEAIAIQWRLLSLKDGMTLDDTVERLGMKGRFSSSAFLADASVTFYQIGKGHRLSIFCSHQGRGLALVSAKLTRTITMKQLNDELLWRTQFDLATSTITLEYKDGVFWRTKSVQLWPPQYEQREVHLQYLVR